MLQETLQKHMVHSGINIHTSAKVKKITTDVASPDVTVPFPKTITLDNGETLEADAVLFAMGRHALTSTLGIENVGVKLQKNGDVIVDEYQKTNIDNIFAIGDVGGVELLTPVAIAAGRRLSNRLYGGVEGDKLDYTNVPTVVFSCVARPPLPLRTPLILHAANTAVPFSAGTLPLELSDLYVQLSFGLASRRAPVASGETICRLRRPRYVSLRSS